MLYISYLKHSNYFSKVTEPNLNVLPVQTSLQDHSYVILSVNYEVKLSLFHVINKKIRLNADISI